MILTKEQIEEVEKWASAFYSAEDVATIMQLHEIDFLNAYNDKTSDVYKAFRRARLKMAGEVRIAVFNQAKAGSGPAQTLAMKIIQNFELDQDE